MQDFLQFKFVWNLLDIFVSMSNFHAVLVFFLDFDCLFRSDKKKLKVNSKIWKIIWSGRIYTEYSIGQKLSVMPADGFNQNWIDTLCIRYLARFFDHCAHETTYASIENKHFFTKSCHFQTYQNSKIRCQNFCSNLLNKML